MGENERPDGRTWEDVKNEMGPGEGLPPEGPPPHGEDGGKPGRKPHHGDPRKRVGAGRLTAYLLLTVLLNVLLAIYTLYILGISAEAVRSVLAAGDIGDWPRFIFGVLILISPLLLTILFNRLLYRALRGRGRFPRGIWLFATVLVVIVQALTIYVIFTAGAAPQLETFTVESFTSAGY